MQFTRRFALMVALAGISVPLTLASLTLVQAAGCPERPSCEGCGCKGGPGYRIDATGKCVGYKALKAKCGDPPTLRCTFENAPGTGLNKDCALGRTAKEPD